MCWRDAVVYCGKKSSTCDLVFMLNSGIAVEGRVRVDSPRAFMSSRFIRNWLNFWDNPICSIIHNEAHQMSVSKFSWISENGSRPWRPGSLTKEALTTDG